VWDIREPSGKGYTLSRENGHWKAIKHQRWMTGAMARPVMENYWLAHAAAVKAECEKAAFKRACDILMEKGAVWPE
jgi:hypothetical protein